MLFLTQRGGGEEIRGDLAIRLANCHTCEGRYPCYASVAKLWIPAKAGMTHARGGQ